jgi:hypothetical protein
MDTGGGTGATEQDSESDQSDQLSVVIHVDSLPIRTEVTGTAPNQFPINIHSIRVYTGVTSIHIETRGLQHATPEFVLLVGEEIIRAARSRVRQGTVQITSL